MANDNSLLTLCLDSHGPWLNLAISQRGTVLHCASREVGNGHSESIPNELRGLLSSASIGICDLQLLAVTVGPGSFTGLRVGISFIKGLGTALNAPCLAINTLDAMAFSCSSDNVWLSPMIDAKKGAIYTALYRNQQGLPVRQSGYLATDPALWLPSLPEGCLLLGSGEIRYRELAEKHPHLRRETKFMNTAMMLCGMARLADLMYRQGDIVSGRKLTAFYARPADVTREKSPA